MNIPNYVRDEVFNVVESAINAGVSVAGFRALCAETWATVLTEKRAADRREWERDA
jgi:hypothetical protein